MSTIGNRIMELRLRDSLSQERLAELLSTGRSTVIRYESGRTYPNSEVIVRLCGVFGVSADYLLGLTDECAPAPASPYARRVRPALPYEHASRPPAQDGPALSSPEAIREYIDREIEAALSRRGLP